jgi:hypothetical protein
LWLGGRRAHPWRTRKRLRLHDDHSCVMPDVLVMMRFAARQRGRGNNSKRHRNGEDLHGNPLLTGSPPQAGFFVIESGAGATKRER